MQSSSAHHLSTEPPTGQGRGQPTAAGRRHGRLRRLARHRGRRAWPTPARRRGRLRRTGGSLRAAADRRPEQPIVRDRRSGRAQPSSRAAGATLAAAFGIGNLLGSLAVTIRPLRGEPETLTTVFLAVIGACLLLCAAAPNLPLALAAFGPAGAANAPFFAATLAARNDYAPAGGRAQVFVAVAALKIAAGSAGTALAGTLGGVGPRWLLVAGSALILLTAASTVIERRVSRSRHSELC